MRHSYGLFLLPFLLAATGLFYAGDAGAQLLCNGFPVTIVGTPGNDFIVGTPGRDVIHGLAGNDDIRSLGGNDVVCGGLGNDVIRLGAGADRGFGGPGHDTIFGQAGNDLIVGNAGNDTLRGDRGADRINGGPGTDDCLGGPGSNTVLNCENSGGPAVCQSPPLTTNFSNLGVFFVDPFNAILVGLTSNGFDVAMVLTDIPFNGAILGLGAFATSSTHCIVDFGVFDTDFDGNITDEIIFNATGICDLVANRTVLFLDNVVLAGVPLGFNITGQCSELVLLNTTVSKGEALSTDDMTAALLDAASIVGEDLTEDLRNDGEEEDSGSIMDFQLDLQD